MTNQPFEQHVIDSLARLETNMDSLIGTGKDGRIDRIEAKVFWLLWIVGTISAAVFGPLAAAMLK